MQFCHRRQFLRQAAIAATSWAGCQLQAADAPGFSFTVIAGKPRERGRQYGQQFKDAITAFLNREFYQAFNGKYQKADLLAYAGACAQVMRKHCPTIIEEMEGMAEGSGLTADEFVLMSLHEELYHKKALPSVPHCHVAAAGPPVTTGDSFVGQTWDWMASAYGKSHLLHWKRPEGPSLLAYGFPGMWVGAGLNAAGIAFAWTSAFNDRSGVKGPAVGVPSYALIAHLLYQDSLKAIAAEAQRVPHAGWFTFVFGDDQGNFLNVEANPNQLIVEAEKGRMVRHMYGSRQMTGTPADQLPKLAGQGDYLRQQLTEGEGKVDLAYMQKILASERVGKACIDLMVFNTSKREAHVSRGPGHKAQWQTFRFA